MPRSTGFPFMTALIPFGAERLPILLIDDDELIARSLRDYLVAKGLRVDVALEASSAAALMAGGDYGAVVVDPYLTGRLHCEEGSLVVTIRAMQPRSTIIVLTGYGSSALLHAAATDDDTIVVAKPQPVPVLSELIHSIPIRKTSERSL